ncbi:alkaline phosphatase [Tsuneonella deserti]|uniref:Alkaline phosphatase n=1 Tax=Tsuneonella deserti TaxID=2035528 RepID=A0ABQ1SCQ5_9SPHN|nr:alkaline phosphatase D family protein [Tsuneonella deserti]GGE02825.1 alkaline phosphatase [Tsuneonella deserti]
MSSQPPGPPGIAIDRRGLLAGGIVGLGMAAAPLRAQTAQGFTHGVASGEPSARSVLLWTRYATGQDAKLRWEVSESADFARIASGGSAVASPRRDWCAKANAKGLKPGTWYHYRFIAPDGSISATGRTRTLPEGATEKFRMAVFSCANLGFGYFNSYAHAAEDDAFELAVHVGDYLYEYDHDTYPTEKQRVAGRTPQPLSEAVHLADYRMRYASYRSDPDLLRLHQLYAMIAVFDDHETANDTWKGGAENHTPATEGTWTARKKAAMQARSEWLPISDESYAQYDIGDLATLFRLETRLIARDRQFDLSGVVRGMAPDQAQAALKAFHDGAYMDPKRTMMGPAQERWLAGAMKSSVRSGRKWQVLVQQVVMGSLLLPPTVSLDLSPEVAKLAQEQMAGLLAATAAGIPFNMDSWDGYPAARKRLLDSARDADANLVVLSGDSHNAWAFELGGAGVEFGGTSVSSPGAESYLPFVKPTALARALVGANAPLKWCDTSRRGYMAVELTQEKAACEWRFADTVRRRDSKHSDTRRLASNHGARVFTEG